MIADVFDETEQADGFDPDQAETEWAEIGIENDSRSGPLAGLSWSWRDIQQARLAAEQRQLAGLAADLKALEGKAAREVGKELRRQPIWPWLSQYPGLGGVHAARLIALIGDARRFPGQTCTEGHHAPAIYAVGDPCPRTSMPDRDGVVTKCDGTMLETRLGTGTRSLWHYLGLHVVDGHSPRKSKGQRADWNPVGRTICLQPGGLGEQIVRLRVPKYREIYDATKARLQNERGVGGARESVTTPGSAQGTEGAEVSCVLAGNAGSLHPYQIEAIARKVAVKAFVGDLLAEMKKLAACHLE
jgi:hypothetical protein